MYVYCIVTVYACIQGCICYLNTLVDWNNMFKSKGPYVRLKYTKTNGFPDYRA